MKSSLWEPRKHTAKTISILPWFQIDCFTLYFELSQSSSTFLKERLFHYFRDFSIVFFPENIVGSLSRTIQIN